ncbi:unnamed protein product [Arctia plantaginis]|uniref:Uncharacterized protein n=1 Tax=Arctia plantaginis TaxID=874455 RepID=A0A8S0Z3K6_ARCPL|nr:unnamed protein product [Arctia plantaginis]
MIHTIFMPITVVQGHPELNIPHVDNNRQYQAVKRNFLRRTKATASPEAAETTPIDITDTTTNKYTRRGNSKFKLRKELPKIVEKNEIEKRPSLNGDARRSERLPATRKFVSRRRFGGANSNCESGFSYLCLFSDLVYNSMYGKLDGNSR